MVIMWEPPPRHTIGAQPCLLSSQHPVWCECSLNPSSWPKSLLLRTRSLAALQIFFIVFDKYILITFSWQECSKKGTIFYSFALWHIIKQYWRKTSNLPIIFELFFGVSRGMMVFENYITVFQVLWYWQSDAPQAVSACVSARAWNLWL